MLTKPASYSARVPLGAGPGVQDERIVQRVDCAVNSADPRTNPDAVKLETVSHFEVLSRGLQVMDSTAITFCMDNALPIIVFDVTQPGNIIRALVGEPIGTLVSTVEGK